MTSQPVVRDIQELADTIESAARLVVSLEIPVNEASRLFKRALYNSLLVSYSGNKSRAMRHCGVHRNTLGNWAKRDIQVERKRN